MSTQKRIYVLVCFLLILGAAAWSFSIQKEFKNMKATTSAPQETLADTTARFKKQKYGGAYTLTDFDGNRTSSDSFQTDYKLTFFGFTHCIAVCPPSLDNISMILNELGEEGKKILPVFITIDPERDTTKTIKDYVLTFHDRFQGFTGSKEELSTVQKNYRIFAKKATGENIPEYQMDHSSYIYLSDKDDHVIHIFKGEDDYEEVTATIRKIMALY